MPATSVPQFTSVHDLKWRMANALAAALDLLKQSGEQHLLQQAVQLTRELYESEMKPAAHKGYLDWRYVNQVGASLEKAEAIAAKLALRASVEDVQRRYPNVMAYLARS